MALSTDLKILWKMVFGKSAGANHADRMEAFYRQQADAYDDFRRRLLHGREEMVRQLDLQPGDRWLDMGGGTGSNLEAVADRIPSLAEISIVDLSASLLKVADDRSARHGWTNVRTVRDDATTHSPSSGPVDAVTFSYSLTMIPDWFLAIDRAFANLKPGGKIGVADFYISRKWPADGLQRHSAFTRHFWRTWFSWDNVFLSPDHLPYLMARFETLYLREGRGKIPYLLGLSAPYYVFCGRKKF
jgi:S-adenosylmethionine-diacylgycerolhomoserine-N-methlytransferase